MKRPALLVGCLALCLLLPAAGVRAQAVVPGVPTIGTVSSGDDSLTIPWSAPPSDGGSPISSYDLRYILSDAESKADDDWTLKEGIWSAGALSHVLTGLTKDTSYDLRVRAVNVNGAGGWSDVSTEATNDHGDSRASATAIGAGASVAGRIDPGGDTDYFTITVSESTDLWVYTTGPTDTVGELTDDIGGTLASNDDRSVPGSTLNFSLRAIIPAGTYYIEVEGYRDTMGPYTLHVRAAAIPGNSITNATEVALGTATPGRTTDSGSHNYFTFELDEESEVWIYTTGQLDTVVALYSWNIDLQRWLYMYAHDDGYIAGNLRGTLIIDTLEAGTYYLAISGYVVTSYNWFTLHVHLVEEAGSTPETATPVRVHFLTSGSSASPTDHQYYRMAVTAPIFARVYAQHTSGISLELALFDADSSELPDQLSPLPTIRNRAFDLKGYLAPGIYYFRVTSTVSSNQMYALHFLIYPPGQLLLDTCLPIEHSLDDLLYGCQWHLDNTHQFSGGAGFDINAEEAWETTLGEGVNVAIVDNGLHYEHPDLRENVDESRNHSYSGSDVSHAGNTHGTAVAGLVAARDNDIGMRGVAPRATIYAYDLTALGLVDADDEQDAMIRNLEATGVSSNSWGFRDNGFPYSAPDTWLGSIERGLAEGYGGKGISYVWAAGNGGAGTDDSNLDGRANHHGVIAVCAIDYGDTRSYYSELGANLWVCAPSSGGGAAPRIATTTNGGYRTDFGGTSAAAPIVSGVVALMRSVNPALTWRDVKLILAASARKNDPGNSGWEEGALRYGSTTARYSFNHEYGFGMVDAAAAVDLADGWTNAPAMRTTTARYQGESFSIPDTPQVGSSRTITTTLTVDEYVEFAEFVEIKIAIDHASFRDLEIDLVSPSGATSRLATEGRAYSFFLAFPALLNETFRMGSARHLGEDPAGEWQLRVTDRVTGRTGRIDWWSLTIYGHGSAPGTAVVKPVAPVITLVAPRYQELGVVWREPAFTGGAISAYDLRHIRSDATDKDVDESWTDSLNPQSVIADDLRRYHIPNLENGVSYDVQARATNSAGDSPWSSTVTGTPDRQNTDPEFPESESGARSLPENTAVDSAVGDPVTATDADSDALTYSLSSASEYFSLHGETGQLRVTKLLDYEVATTHTLTMNVTDGRDIHGDVDNTIDDTLEVTVTVEDVNEGFTVSGPDHISREENTTGVLATFAATDPEGFPLVWSVEGVDYEAMRINARGELSFNVPPDYDQPADMQRANLYHIEVIARDEVNESALPVTIQVTNVDEAPVLSGEAHVTLEENSGVFVGCYGAADPERAEVTWKALSGLDGSKFELIDGTDPCTRELRFKEPPDFDARADSNRDDRYQVTLNTSDKASAGKPGSLAVTVTLTDVDEPPVITGPASVDFDENATGTVATYSALDPEAGTVALRLIGSDSDDFSFTDGVLRFDSAPNFEDPDDAGGNNTYEVIVEARDALDTATQDVTVNVTNVDEAGGLTLSSQQPQVGTELTATLTDLDGGLSGQSWTWERSPNRSSGWSTIGGASGRRYTPVDGDLDHYLRVTVDYTDGHGSGKDEQATSMNRVQAAPVVNNPPEFPNPTEERSVLENSAAGTRVGEAVQATDPDTGDVLGYTLSGADADSFTIDVASGQIRVGVGTMLDRESKDTYRVTVTASDPSTATDTAAVTITIEDVNEPPVAVNDTAETDEDPDTATLINVLDNDADPENEPLTVSLRQEPRYGTAILNPDNTFSYTPNPDTNGIQSFTYTVSASPHTAWATVFVTVNGVNDAPEFDPPEVSRSVVETATGGTKVGAPVTAEDVDGDVLMYSLSGGGSLFEIESHTAQITVVAGALFDRIKEPEHVLTVTAFDRDTEATATVTVTVSDRAVAPISFGGGGFAGGGGGGGGGGPSPSVVDFEWTVSRDIEELDGGHGTPSGQWSDGATLWVLENGDGADDAIYAYDLATGERVEDREFELDETNRAPRGVWSDGSTAWVSDSGQEKLFAHDLGSGERLPERDIAFADRNRDARGIWSDTLTMWVLDGGKESLFAYDLGSGESLVEYALDDANDDPRGLFFDGVTFWVSDHGEKRIFAYRLEAGEDGEDGLERNRDEEFPNAVLSRAGNNSPRGLWSDGDVMYVADESDARVYTYNMPDAIDARLSSLTLSGVDIGEFDRNRTDYQAVVADGVTETTVTAEALQRRTDIAIDPPDADEAAEGYQVALEDLTEITVTVTSADGSRKKTYRVRLAQEEVAEPAEEEVAEAAPEEAAGPAPECLRGAVAVGFSLVVYAGGSIEDLVACAEGRNVTALYTLDSGAFVSYILGAPELVNRSFAGLFADGVPALTPLIARSDGPATADPDPDAVTGPLAACLQGEIAKGFNLVVYEGGSVGELEACAEGVGLAALYALSDGVWVSYIVGAPEFVNAGFRELFTDGVPVATPLVGKRD